MLNIKSMLITATLTSILFTGCANKHEEAMKVLPNELAIADNCKNTNKQFEIDCYDLISYKNSFAQIRLGLLAQTKDNYEEAFQRYSLAQTKGNFYANALLADLYNKGLGTQRSQEKVLELLEETKDADPIASYKLAFHYLGERKYKKAIELLTFAGENDIKKAQIELSKVYGTEEFENLDLDKSQYWYEQSQNGSADFIEKIYGR